MLNFQAPTTYVHWGVLLISLPNLIVIALMVLVFTLAILVPMSSNTRESDERTNQGP